MCYIKKPPCEITTQQDPLLFFPEISELFNEPYSPSEYSSNNSTICPSFTVKRKAEEEVTDAVALKRLKNKEAAQRSRAKKLSKLHELEGQVAQLESEKLDLSVKLAVMETEKTIWQSREQELMSRIEKLESSLFGRF